MLKPRFITSFVCGLFVGLGFSLRARSARADVNVVATLPDLAAIAKEVGGDHVQVTALVDPAQDPPLH